MTDVVIQELRERGIETVQDVSLQNACTFRIGGRADLGVYPKNEAEMRTSVLLLRRHAIPFAVIGKGSNVLFGDGHLTGAVLFTEKMTLLRREENLLYAECGVSLASLASEAAEASLSGLEFAKGIPGSVGGAVFMNAGAYGASMSDVVVFSRSLCTECGEIEEIRDHHFGYRQSIYGENPNRICLGVGFRLKNGNRETIEQTMREYARKRRASQPLEYPSAGSYFKRPTGDFAGRLIEAAELKGFGVGGAQVSEKHAGFLINRGGATAADVLAAEAHVKEEVKRRFGVELQREVCLIDKL